MEISWTRSGSLTQKENQYLCCLFYTASAALYGDFMDSLWQSNSAENQYLCCLFYTASAALYGEFMDSLKSNAAENQVFDLLGDYERIVTDQVSLLKKLVKRATPGQNKYVAALPLLFQICQAHPENALTTLSIPLYPEYVKENILRSNIDQKPIYKPFSITILKHKCGDLSIRRVLLVEKHLRLCFLLSNIEINSLSFTLYIGL